MTHTLRVAAIGAALSFGAVPAFAADVLVAPPPRVIPAPIDVGGGWYLRGDVGVGVQRFKDVEFSVPGQPLAFQGFRRETEAMDDPTIIGIGAGYQFNEWLRADATLEYRGASRFGYTLVERVTDPTFPFTNVFSGQISSTVGLLNVYADIGNFYGLTPFIGAGIGFAHHRVSNFTDTGQVASAGGYGIAPKTNSTEFAWALHAGVGYTVNENLKLELSYRYLNMGDIHLGTIDCFTPCPSPRYDLASVTSHDFRLGMRWMLNPPAPVMAPQPVIARN